VASIASKIRHLSSNITFIKTLTALTALNVLFLARYTAHIFSSFGAANCFNIDPQFFTSDLHDKLKKKLLCFQSSI
jgi:hypothetical protein